MLHIVATFDLRNADRDLFDRYEAAVLPLLPEHGGTLLHRLRSQDEETEVHVLAFASERHLGRFQADPRRAAVAALFEQSGVKSQVQRFWLIDSRLR